jgi:hypothetical protein
MAAQTCCLLLFYCFWLQKGLIQEVASNGKRGTNVEKKNKLHFFLKQRR